MNWKIAVLLFFTFGATQAQELVINEVMHANATSVADEFGSHPDWIELYNPESVSVSIEGYYLSDDPDDLEKWQFPEASIPAGDFMVVFASGNDLYFAEDFHTNFRLSADGEPLFLSNANGVIIDSYPSIVMRTDQSYGRLEDGGNPLTIFDESTPGYANELGVPGYVYTDSLFFSAEQGIYSNPFWLEISNNDPDAVVRYTTNGSNPTESSAVFADALFIEDRTSEPNSISTIPTNPPETYGTAGWQPPSGPVFKAVVLKAQAFKNDQPISEISTKTYFVHPDLSEKYNEMPLISLVTDSLHLFDYETGIYVPGLFHDEDTIYEPFHGVGNYILRGMEWERPVNATLFEPDGTVGFSQNLGLRIHGGGTRQMPLKALRLYARNIYGDNEIDYRFFPWKDTDKYRRILLRSSGNDFRITFITDAVSAALMSEIGEGYQDTRPAVLFINGEFWGIHNIRDRLDKHYLEYRFGADHDHVEIIENWENADPGSMEHYASLKDFIEENDLAIDANYEFAKAQIDMDSFMDNYIVRLYTAVEDWPHNNMSFWRRTDEQGDKWKWLFYDNDKAMVNPSFDAILHGSSHEESPSYTTETSVFLFRNLLKNASFRQEFAERFRQYLEREFQAEQVIGIIDSISSKLAPVMQEHIDRWQFPTSYSYWEGEVDRLRDFAEHRPCHMVYHLYRHFEIQDSTYAFGICDSISTPPEVTPLPDEILVWPNPTAYLVNIQYESEHELRGISLYDLSGKYVKSPSINHSGNRRVSFAVNDLPAGLYIIRIQTQLGLYHRKLIVGE
ncbi:MAG: CotH kinase family protein [Cryomorphaceae bacterium]|nr:CotH kinase family protein [Flavobacteriales bacterium]